MANKSSISSIVISFHYQNITGENIDPVKLITRLPNTSLLTQFGELFAGKDHSLLNEEKSLVMYLKHSQITETVSTLVTAIPPNYRLVRCVADITEDKIKTDLEKLGLGLGNFQNSNLMLLALRYNEVH